jgi:hypothetical protein
VYHRAYLSDRFLLRENIFPHRSNQKENAVIDFCRIRILTKANERENAISLVSLLNVRHICRLLVLLHH